MTMMTTRRYTAEELNLIAEDMMDASLAIMEDGFQDDASRFLQASAAIRQASETEDKMMGLVEALEEISSLGRRVDAEIARKALSKFRGES